MFKNNKVLQNNKVKQIIIIIIIVVIMIIVIIIKKKNRLPSKIPIFGFKMQKNIHLVKDMKMLYIH